MYSIGGDGRDDLAEHVPDGRVDPLRRDEGVHDREVRGEPGGRRRVEPGAPATDERLRLGDRDEEDALDGVGELVWLRLAGGGG